MNSLSTVSIVLPPHIPPPLSLISDELTV